MTGIPHPETGPLYQCRECGFHYQDQETAQRCAAWCRAHKSCNLEITASAVENQTPTRPRAPPESSTTNP